MYHYERGYDKTVSMPAFCRGHTKNAWQRRFTSHSAAGQTITYILLTTSLRSLVWTSRVMISIIFLRIWRTCWCWAYEVFLIWLVRFFVKPTQNRRSRYPSVVFTSTWASIIVCVEEMHPSESTTFHHKDIEELYSQHMHTYLAICDVHQVLWITLCSKLPFMLNFTQPAYQLNISYFNEDILSPPDFLNHGKMHYIGCFFNLSMPCNQGKSHIHKCHWRKKYSHWKNVCSTIPVSKLINYSSTIKHKEEKSYMGNSDNLPFQWEKVLLQIDKECLQLDHQPNVSVYAYITWPQLYFTLFTRQSQSTKHVRDFLRW